MAIAADKPMLLAARLNDLSLLAALNLPDDSFYVHCAGDCGELLAVSACSKPFVAAGAVPICKGCVTRLARDRRKRFPAAMTPEQLDAARRYAE